MKFAFIHAEKARWPIEVQCDVFEVSRSGYYAWAARPASPRAVEDAALIVEIKAAHRTGRGAYGSPRVHRELRAKGRRIGKKRVERLMREEGIVARKKRRFRRTTDSNHPHPKDDAAEMASGCCGEETETALKALDGAVMSAFIRATKPAVS